MPSQPGGTSYPKAAPNTPDALNPDLPEFRLRKFLDARANNTAAQNYDMATRSGKEWHAEQEATAAEALRQVLPQPAATYAQPLTIDIGGFILTIRQKKT